MSDFYVYRVLPREFSYKDAVDTAECITAGFINDPFMTAVLGERYALTLDDIRSNSSTYRSVVHAWARFVHDSVLSPANDLYLVKERKSGKVVGEALWKYPEYMVPELCTDLKRVGFWWRFTSWLKRQWIGVQNMVRILCHRSPILNRTMLKFLRGHRQEFGSKLTAEQAKDMSFEQLKDSLDYPHDMMVFCTLFCIHHDYQGKGLGKLLMTTAIDTIPSTAPPAPFAGPQKIYLEATRRGKLLYERTGFVDTGKSWSAPFVDPKLDHISIYMVLTRGK
uniref:ARAD1D10692p n=1 Tax=Blastobotrys adeninivorans TaxID=409370 RepID=A0A060T8W1_BLAAD